MLGITSAYMTNLTRGERIVSSDLAIKLGELAGLPLTYVAASIEHERARRSGNAETSGVWKAIAESLAGKAASVLLAVVAVGALTLAPSPVSAQALTPAIVACAGAVTVYYVKFLAWLRGRAATRRGTVTGALPVRLASVL